MRKWKGVLLASLILSLPVAVAGWFLVPRCDVTGAACHVLTSSSWYVFPLQVEIFANFLVQFRVLGDVQMWSVFMAFALPACVAMAYVWRTWGAVKFAAAYLVACVVMYFVAVQAMVWEMKPVPTTAEASQDVFDTPHCVPVDKVPQEVTVEALLANPERFEGRSVRVEGYYYNRFELRALFSSRVEPYASREPAVWVTGIPVFNHFSDRHVAIVGVYTSSERGHGSLWPGTLCALSAGVVPSLQK